MTADAFASSSSVPTVQQGSFLTLHYRLAGPAGDVINTFEDKPATLSVGTGELSPALEQRLIDLPEGARATFELAAGEAATDILSLAFSNEKEPDVEAAEGALAALRGAQLASEMRTVQEEIDRGAPPEELARLLQRKIALARELQKGAAGAASARRSPPRS